LAREASGRPTRLIVDRSAIEDNASILAGRLMPPARLMAVVKANGYGHGSIESARAAILGGASFLGVATVSEALELRESGLETCTLVLSSSDPREAIVAAASGISIGVGDSDQISALLDVLDRDSPSIPLRVHIKIDTGMRRFGIRPLQAPGIATRLHEHPSIEVGGIYSHFSEADGATEERLNEQLDVFRAVLAEVDGLGIPRGLAHISNSAALLRNHAADLDMVRAGICLYGISPSEHIELVEGMRPALEWRATVQHIAEMAPGDRTGYGGTYVANEHQRIALLPIGYADGYPRHLSNRGWVGYQGARLPVRGRISMDQCAVGIPAGVELSVGDEVIVLGDPATGAPSANQLANLIDTIGYEIVSRISRRVPVEYR
jgi:alanine racemase